MISFSRVAGAVATHTIASLILAVIVSYPVMLLWNGAVTSALTVAKEIGYLDAFGIIFLMNLLFKTKIEVEMKS